MPGGLGGLGGLGNVLPGYNAEYDQITKQMGDAAFGRTLQLLGQSQQQPQPPMPPGQPPMPGGMPPPQMPGLNPGMGGQAPQGMPPRPMMPPDGQMQPPPQQPMGGPPQPQQMPPQASLPQQGGGQPGMGQPQSPQLDWQSVFQKVRQANPQAPPQVLAAAVDRFLPLMNQQSQMQWKQFSEQLRQQQVQNQQQTAQDRIGLGEERLGMERDRINMMREQYGLPPLPAQGGGAPESGGQPQQTGDKKPEGNADLIADQIAAGKRPPNPTGLYRMSGPVAASLARNHPDFNQSQAQLEYKRAEKLVQSLNGPQQTRFLALGNSVVNTIDEVKGLAKEMQNSGIIPLNKLKLDALINTAGNTKEGQLAARYVGAVATLKEEFANLANGGYAPTESAWAQANNVVNGNYGVDELNASLSEVQRLIGYRLTAQQEIGGGNMGPGAPNRYTNPQTGEPTKKSGWSEDSGAKPAGVIKYDAQGNRIE